MAKFTYETGENIVKTAEMLQKDADFAAIKAKFDAKAAKAQKQKPAKVEKKQKPAQVERVECSAATTRKPTAAELAQIERRFAKQAQTAKQTGRQTAKRKAADGNKANDAQTFETLMRAFEQSPETAIMPLARACAASVVCKCIDPQRKTAANSDKVSKSGFNPAMVKLRREVQTDCSTLDNLQEAMNDALSHAFNKNGDLVELVDKVAEGRVKQIISKSLGDGIDLVQEAACKLWEQYGKHGGPEKWLERPYTVRKLDKRVLIRRDDSASWREEETTPIQEVFRVVRDKVDDSGAVKSASAKYAYINALVDDDGEEQVYRRLALYSDLGGYPCNGIFSMAGAPAEYGAGGGAYTAGEDTEAQYYALRDSLTLTHRQEQILKLREKGYGLRAIASYLGVKPETICTTLRRLQARCTAAGFTPHK